LYSHVGDQLLCHQEFIALQAIHAEQQPATQLPVQRMVPVADSRLRHLRDQRLGIAKQQVHDRPTPPELLLHQRGFKPQANTCALHYGAAGCCMRIPATLNTFIDRHGLLDEDYDRQSDSGSLLWLLRSDRLRISTPGSYLVVVDSQQQQRPEWSPLPTGPTPMNAQPRDHR
jgi:hypothetical protein